MKLPWRRAGKAGLRAGLDFDCGRILGPGLQRKCNTESQEGSKQYPVLEVCRFGDSKSIERFHFSYKAGGWRLPGKV